MTPPASTVRVSTAGGGYDVLVGRGLLHDLGSRCDAAGLRPRRVHVFEDTGVPATLREAARSSFSNILVTRSAFEPDEQRKSLATLERMLVDLAEASLERTDLVVVVGGGILGDAGGLAAALHRRGVAVVQCPTTLLAMVDASVGGKTAVNLPARIDAKEVLLKNGVGVFHQPSLVLADVDALASLAPRQVRCGLAESIKHAVIAGAAGTGMLALDGLSLELPKLLSGESEALSSLVQQNVSLKAGVVAGDELELAAGAQAGRRALNLGHTFAHAIEGNSDTRVLVDGTEVHPMHGEAVALGLIAAATLAEHLGVGRQQLTTSVRTAAAAAGLPTRLSAAGSLADLTATMRQDKKASGGLLRLVLPSDAGVVIRDDPGDEAVFHAWQAVV